MNPIEFDGICPSYSLDESPILSLEQIFHQITGYTFLDPGDSEEPEEPDDPFNPNNNSNTESNNNSNTQFSSLDNQIKEYNNKNDNSFVGKKRKSDKKPHTKFDLDNILRKIQVHFQKFTINYCNEILSYFDIHEQFLQIDYNFKKVINKKNFNELKSKNVGFILRQEISNKYRKYKDDKDKNIRLYDKLIKNEELKELLTESYINLFRNIYYQSVRQVNYGGKTINLSQNVKTFNDILENPKYDGLYKEKILKAVEEFYLPKQKFMTIIKN